MRFRPHILFAALSSFFACGAAHATTDADLQAIVGKRLHGDSSGACFAVAVIDKTVSRAYVCADGKDAADRMGVEAETVHIENALPAEAIIQAAQARNCGLIAMSSHGRRGLGRLVLGSVTAEVLAHSPVPVLVMR